MHNLEVISSMCGVTEKLRNGNKTQLESMGMHTAPLSFFLRYQSFSTLQIPLYERVVNLRDTFSSWIPVIFLGYTWFTIVHIAMLGTSTDCNSLLATRRL